jgi:hypothetical protein
MFSIYLRSSRLISRFHILHFEINTYLGMLAICIQGYPRQTALLFSISNVEIFENSWIEFRQAREQGIAEMKATRVFFLWNNTPNRVIRSANLIPSLLFCRCRRLLYTTVCVM